MSGSAHPGVASPSLPPVSPGPRRVISKSELRRTKAARDAFAALPRRPITVLLDGIGQNYNIGAIFRLCDAFLVERLVICGTKVNLRKRRLVRAAIGSQRWVPWQQAESAAATVAAARSQGASIVVAEQASGSISPERLKPAFPVCLVMGSEIAGVSQEVLDMADAVVTIPMLGMANSINVATAAAILLYRLSVLFEGRTAGADPRRSNSDG